MGVACREWGKHGDYALETLGMDEADLEELEPELTAALKEKAQESRRTAGRIPPSPGCLVAR